MGEAARGSAAPARRRHPEGDHAACLAARDVRDVTRGRDATAPYGAARSNRADMAVPFGAVAVRGAPGLALRHVSEPACSPRDPCAAGTLVLRDEGPSQGRPGGAGPGLQPGEYRLHPRVILREAR